TSHISTSGARLGRNGSTFSATIVDQAIVHSLTLVSATATYLQACFRLNSTSA
ncbi:Unknown protein, partial [Striga hermonthica]